MANKVLVIRSSMIKKELSYSESLVSRFVKYYREFHPEDSIIELDLNQIPMASITITQKNFTSYFNEKDSDYYINQLKNVNKVIYTTPMTNFNVTSMTKNYLDHILVAGKTFDYKYTKQGEARGLLPHLKVQILATQGAPYGWYLWGNHATYLKGTWEFVGAKVVEPILICGTKVQELHQNDANLLIGSKILAKGGGLPALGPEKTMDKFEQYIKEAAKKF
ncbi:MULTISPECIES: FMN-dependent NADH-azoreductase [unclassified Spiroplasma]|uniref:FMN-dependent NADH-azoreductase n=1 Tax=unclassified Spiroplasma TaxID=2637901 RepID=UPI0027A542E5|nr:MAG: FMN-dependent NADH-azoreductase [Spiroplasma endosymbiont of Drosophila atripex]